MNNEIHQHRPASFDCGENEAVQFDTLDQMLKIPWVKNFSSGVSFHRFSISRNMLIAEYDCGAKWFVVGYLKNPVGLPEWKHR